MINYNLDLSRCSDVFNPSKLDAEINIIGAGALGSWATLMLCKLGIDGSKITVWDYDTVEPGNVTNQLYGNNHVGMLKTEALKQIIEEQLNTSINIKTERWEGQRLNGYVIALVDSMLGRKKLFNHIKMKATVKGFFDGRMGIDTYRIYYVHPLTMSHLKGYEETLYDDSNAEVSSCGTSLSVIHQAMMCSAYLVRQFVDVINQSPKINNELITDNLYDQILAEEWV